MLLLHAWLHVFVACNCCMHGCMHLFHVIVSCNCWKHVYIYLWHVIVAFICCMNLLHLFLEQAFDEREAEFSWAELVDNGASAMLGNVIFGSKYVITNWNNLKQPDPTLYIQMITYIQEASGLIANKTVVFWTKS